MTLFHDFPFSNSKTELIVFQKPRKSVILFLPLTLENSTISQMETTKLLQLHCHFRHLWAPHIKTINAKYEYLRALNILKFLFQLTNGCNLQNPFPSQSELNPLYSLLCRIGSNPTKWSRNFCLKFIQVLKLILYFFSMFSNSILLLLIALKLVESIQNSAILIATGAFQTSPAVSLCSERRNLPFS